MKINKNILSTLAELNNPKAVAKLKDYARQIQKSIIQHNNDARLEDLELLEKFAFRVPQEAIDIINLFIDQNLEKSPIQYIKPIPYVGHKHKDVLEKCLEIMKQLRYVLFDPSLKTLLAFYQYKPEDKNYDEVRKKAKEIMISTADYNLRVIHPEGYPFQGYKFQELFTEKVKIMIGDKNDSIFHLSLDIAQELLKTEVEGNYWNYKTFTIKFGPALYTASLKNIRKKIIKLMFQKIKTESSEERKLSLIKALASGMQFPIRGKYSNELEQMIMDDINEIINFYSKLILSKTNSAILQEIERQVSFQRRRFLEYKNENKTYALKISKKSHNLLIKLRGDPFYKIYRIFVGDEMDFLDEDDDFEKIRIERSKAIENFTNSIDNKSLSRLVKLLNEIAKTYSLKEDYQFENLRVFVRNLGERKPDFSIKLMNVLLKQKFLLKDLFIDLVRGMRQSNKKHLVNFCIATWLKSKDFDLIMGIPYTFWGVSEQLINPKDVDLFKKLILLKISKERKSKLDQRLLVTIPWVYKQNPKLSDELILIILKRLPEEQLTIFADTIMMAGYRKQIEINKLPNSFFKIAMNKYLKKQRLEYHDEEVLAIYTARDPLGLIEFFRKRIDISRKKKREEKPSIPSYDAIPFQLGKISQAITTHKDYKKVIKKILSEWMESKDWQLQWEGKHFIYELSPNLDQILKLELLHKINSKEKKKIIGALEVLDGYQGSPVIDDVCKEAIRISKGDKDIKNIVARALFQTGVVMGEYGFSNAYKQKIERLKEWIKDKDKYVKIFAEEFSRNLEEDIRRENKRVEEEIMRMKKGVDL